MLHGVLAIHKSGVLMATKGKNGELEKADRVSNLISATLLLAETIEEKAVKSIEMGEHTLTITQCPTRQNVLVVTLTDKEDKNAGIITNFAAEIVDETIQDTQDLSVIPQELTKKIENALEQNVFNIELPPLPKLLEQLKTVYNQISNKSYQEREKSLKRQKKKQRKKERKRYQNARKKLSKKINIPENNDKAIEKGISLFYQFEFLPAYHIFTSLTDKNSKMKNWAKLLAVATGINLIQFHTKSPAPPLEELENLLNTLKPEKRSKKLLKEFLTLKTKFYRNPLQAIRQIRNFKTKYLKLFLKLLEKLNNRETNLIIISLTPLLPRSKKLTDAILETSPNDSTLFYHYYTTKNKLRTHLFSFSQLQSSLNWSKAYDSIVKTHKIFEKIKEKEKKARKKGEKKKYTYFRGLKNLTFAYFLATIVDAFKSVRNLPEEAVEFLKEALNEIKTQLSQSFKEPGLLSFRDYILMLNYSHIVRKISLQLFYYKDRDIQRKDLDILDIPNFKLKFPEVGTFFSIENEELLKLFSISLLSNLPINDVDFQDSDILPLLHSVINFLEKNKANFNRLSFNIRWHLTQKLIRALTTLIEKKFNIYNEKYLSSIYLLQESLINVTLAKGYISWFLFSDFLSFSRTILKKLKDSDKLIEIIKFFDKFINTLLEPTENSWRKKRIANQHINFLHTCYTQHKNNLLLRKKIKETIKPLLNITEKQLSEIFQK